MSIKRNPGYAHIFAILLNCSNKFLGKKVRIVYLDVTTWLVI